jgi:hypothetical protein
MDQPADTRRTGFRSTFILAALARSVVSRVAPSPSARRFSCLVLVGALLLIWFGTQPLVWRAYLIPAADRQDHTFRVKVTSGHSSKGAVVSDTRSQSADFAPTPVGTATTASALWEAGRSGIYRFRLVSKGTDARVTLDGRELVWPPDGREFAWAPAEPGVRVCRVNVDEGTHLLVVRAGGGATEPVRLAVSAPGEATFTPIQGDAVTGLPVARLKDACAALRIADVVAPIGLVLGIVCWPVFIGRSFGAFWAPCARRPVQTLTAATFLGFLVLPALQNRFGWFSDEPLDENRVRAVLPEVTWEGLIRTDGEVAAKFEKYFNDHYGLRDTFVRLKHQIDFSLFRKSDQVVVAREDWMEYRQVLEEQEIAAERGGDALFQDLCKNTLHLQELLSRRGIQLVVVPAPMKNTVYPDQFAGRSPRRPAPTCFDKYRQFLATRPEIIAVDATEILEREKHRMPTFHKYDFHWNDPAGFLVARELVDALGRKEAVGPVWRHGLEVELKAMDHGGLSHSLGLMAPLVEQALNVRRNWAEAGRIDFARPRPFGWRYTDPNDGLAKLPPTVVVGNSFSHSFQRSGYYVYFHDISHVTHHAAYWPEILASIPPGTRYLVFQFIESQMAGWMFQDLPPIPAASGDPTKEAVRK